MDLLSGVNNILVVCCEAGGANILSSFVSAHPHKQFLVCLDGPAEAIFGSKLGNIRRVKLDVIRNSAFQIDMVVTGTSWRPALERRALACAKEHNIKTVSVLDHWTNFRERFLPTELWKNIPSDWQRFLPDQIWVCDRYAYKIAIKNGFPPDKLYEISNPYLAEVVSLFKRKKSNEKDAKSVTFKLLYISEPILDDMLSTYGAPDYRGYTEFDVVRSLVDCVSKRTKRGSSLKVRFRLHPNEKDDKYDDILLNYEEIDKSKECDLVDDLIWSDAVLGGESMVLVIAVTVGKPSYSFLPKSAKNKCCLPQEGIKHIDSIDRLFDDFL